MAAPMCLDVRAALIVTIKWVVLLLATGVCVGIWGALSQDYAGLLTLQAIGG